MSNNNQTDFKRVLGIFLIIASIPGLVYTLVVSIGGGPLFFIVFLAFWLYWVPSLIALFVGLNFYWATKMKSKTHQKVGS